MSYLFVPQAHDYCSGVTGASSVLVQAFYEGLMDGMNRYRTEIDMKISIDRTQMKYRCCGSLSYEDWFEIAWVDVQFVDKFNREVSKSAPTFPDAFFSSHAYL